MATNSEEESSDPTATGSSDESPKGPARQVSTEPETKQDTASSSLPARSTVAQMVCIIAVAGVAIYDLRTPGESVPAIVYGTLLGAALGIDPMAILRGWSSK